MQPLVVMVIGDLTAVLFPGDIKPSSERPLSAIVPEYIDKDFNLSLSSSVRISPTTEEPSTKLIFKKSFNPDGTTTTVFLGSTVREIKYTAMADFSYDPPDFESHIIGPVISKQTQPQVYNYEGNPSVAILVAKEEASKAMEEGEVAFLRFRDGHRVPSKPTPLTEQRAIESDEAERELVQRVRKLFEARPVWQRSSLEEALGLDSGDWKLAGALRLVSYLFLDGPWRKCYVRFGYDPRIDPQARKLQMIDFRDPFLRSEDVPRTPTARPDVHFRRAPIQRSQLYQLCDIEDPGIEALLNGPCKLITADAHTGWLTELELDSIRNQLKIKSEALRRLS